MTVDCSGLDSDGRQISSRWLLIAQKGQGPIVPVLPAVALTRALLAGAIKPGARTAGGVLPLASLEAELPAPDVTTRRSDTRGEGPSIIERACGKAYRELPRALAAFHDRDGPSISAGEADVDASETLIGKVMRAVFGFPPSGRRVPVTVTVDRLGDSEKWTRNFGGRRFASRLAHEGGNLISERFGPFKILLGLSARNGAIEMPVVGWRLGMIPLPKSFAPHSDTREYVDEYNRFRFDVAISLPLVGQIAHYRGWLEPRARTAEGRQCACAEGQEPS